MPVGLRGQTCACGNNLLKKNGLKRMPLLVDCIQVVCFPRCLSSLVVFYMHVKIMIQIARTGQQREIACAIFPGAWAAGPNNAHAAEHICRVTSRIELPHVAHTYEPILPHVTLI